MWKAVRARLRRSALGALSLVWLPLPQRLRVRVPPGRRAEIRAAIRKSRALLRADPDFHGGGSPTDRHRQALRLLLAAVARAEHPDALSEDEAVRVGSVRVASTLTDPALAEALAQAGDPSPPGAVDVGSLARLRTLRAWTHALLDTRSEREVRVVRRLRWVVPALAAAIGAPLLFGDRNLALGKTVTASSICTSAPAPSSGKGRWSRLVDGKRVERFDGQGEGTHGTYAACTDNQQNPWITVDLGAERTVNEVVVYNRSDCCWGADDTPLSIQISSDNQKFETVATRYDPISDDFPWRRAIGHRRARYVRLFNPSDLRKNMVLSEIEIYGR